MRITPGRMVAVASVVISCAAARTAWPCTTFLAWHAGQPVVGKNYDWNQNAGLVTVNPRGLEKKALVLSLTDTPATWTAKYGSLTFNQYGVEMPNGGMNEKGLAIEIMWLDSSQYPVADSRPVVNELQWIQRGLDLFATVDELARDAPSVRVSRAYARVHYLACDAQAACAAFEYIDGQLVVTSVDKMLAKTLTNDTYDDSASYLSTFSGFGGTEAMTSSSSSLARFARASMLARTTEGTTIPGSAYGILESVVLSSTVWSIVYVPQGGLVHFRTTSMSKVKSVRLPDFSLTCGTRKVLDIDTDATGDVKARFVDYSQAANRDLLTRSMADMASQLPAGILDMLVAYPDGLRCATSSSAGSCSFAVDARPRRGSVGFLLLLGLAFRLLLGARK
jgi:penicillin V acylase-like amidase (Ntn superfamily)